MCFSVALHPSGFTLAVGSKDSLTIHNVLIQSLSELAVLPVKQVRAVRYCTCLRVACTACCMPCVLHVDMLLCVFCVLLLQLRYSSGGNMLAASTGLIVTIFHAYTHQQLFAFPGHAGAIRQLTFSADNSVLCSAGEDGHVYCFSILPVGGGPPGRLEDRCHVVKSCSFTTVCVTNDNRVVFSAGVCTSVALHSSFGLRLCWCTSLPLRP